VSLSCSSLESVLSLSQESEMSDFNVVTLSSISLCSGRAHFVLAWFMFFHNLHQSHKANIKVRKG
jgi:hypothetical protein